MGIYNAHTYPAQGCSTQLVYVTIEKHSHIIM